jgi:ABC-type antimicrobial peptide transport system permease subunit
MLGHAALALSIALPAGIAGALLASRLLQRYMFNISASDPAIYAAVAAALAAVVLFASWLPARQAGRVDPAASVRT